MAFKNKTVLIYITSGQGQNSGEVSKRHTSAKFKGVSPNLSNQDKYYFNETFLKVKINAKIHNEQIPIFLTKIGSMLRAKRCILVRVGLFMLKFL